MARMRIIRMCYAQVQVRVPVSTLREPPPALYLRRISMGLRISTFIVSMALLAGCDTGPKSSAGFTLPDGDVAAGKAVFMASNCSSCHKVVGMPELREGIDLEMDIMLGGKTTRIKTYGQLVTSIINPSHKLARGYTKEVVSDDGVSKMRNYNDELTVAELIDLVAFVQDQYEIYMPPRSSYPPYTY